MLNETNESPSIWGTLNTLISSGAAAYSQDQLLKANLKLASAGKKTISSESIAPTVNVGASDSTKKMLYIGLAIGAGILLLKTMRK